MNIRGRVKILVAGLVLSALCASGALAQSAPWRIAQASDGTLFLLKDGVRYAIVGEPIEDDELGAYAEGDPIGGSLLLNARTPGPPSAPAPVGDAPATGATGANQSAPGTGTQPSSPTQAAIPPQFVSIQGNAPGQTASVTVRTAPGLVCSLGFAIPAATRAGPIGLGQQTADSSGVATWSFPIGATTPTGRGMVTATCDGVAISSPIQIGSPLSR